MSNQADETAFSARIFFFAVAGLGLLAGAVVVYVVASRANADREAVAARFAEPSDGGGPASTAPVVDGAKPTTSDPAVPFPSPESPSTETGEPAGPVVAAVDVEPAEAAEADEAAGLTSDRSLILGDWRLQVLSVVSSPFAFTERGVAGPRVAGVAPTGERYVQVELELSWRGVDPRRVEVSRSGSLRPSVAFATESQSFDPAGRLADEPDAFMPLRTDSVVWQPGETKTITIAFRVPNELTSGVLKLEDLAGPSIELPAAPEADAVRLAGRWRRSDRLLQAVRSGEPVIDAMSDGNSGLLLISRSGGSLTLLLPGAGISGKGPLTGGGIPLTMGRSTASARPRILAGEDELLLYVGEAGRALLYERWSAPDPDAPITEAGSNVDGQPEG